MPYPNFHAARLREPSDFIDGSFITLSRGQPKGITRLVGQLKDGEPRRDETTQAIRFAKEEFTDKEARAWLKEHDEKPILFEPASEPVEAKADDMDPEIPEGDPVPDVGIGPTGGLDIGIRDKYRHTPLSRLDHKTLNKRHLTLHALFRDRDEGTATEAFVNAHLTVLRVFEEKDWKHPLPPKNSAELDELSEEAAAESETSAQIGEIGKTITIKVIKSWSGRGADDKRDVFFSVGHLPYLVDKQGDWLDERDVFDAANIFTLNGLRLNLEHDRVCGSCGASVSGPPVDIPVSCPKCGAAWKPKRLRAGEAMVVQNYTAPVSFVVDKDGEERPFIGLDDVDKEAGDILIPKGSWIVGTKFAGEALDWVKKGMLRGISLQGKSTALFDRRPEELKEAYP